MPLRAAQNLKVVLTVLDDISDTAEDPCQPPPLSKELPPAALGLSMPGKPGERQEEHTHYEGGRGQRSTFSKIRRGVPLVELLLANRTEK